MLQVARLFSLLVLMGLVLVPAEAQKKKGGGKKKGADPEATQVLNLGPATIAGEAPGELASDAGKQSDWPAIAFSKDGALWAAYVEWNDRNADRLVVRRRVTESTNCFRALRTTLFARGPPLIHTMICSAAAQGPCIACVCI